MAEDKVQSIGTTLKKCLDDAADVIRERYTKMCSMYVGIARELAPHIKADVFKDVVHTHEYYAPITGSEKKSERIVYCYLLNSLYSMIAYMERDENGKPMADEKLDSAFIECLEYDFAMNAYGLVKGIGLVYQMIEVKKLCDSIKADMRIMLGITGQFTIIPTAMSYANGYKWHLSAELAPILHLVLNRIEISLPPFEELGVSAELLNFVR